jgi:hypothetical protein
MANSPSPVEAAPIQATSDLEPTPFSAAGNGSETRDTTSVPESTGEPIKRESVDSAIGPTAHSVVSPDLEMDDASDARMLNMKENFGAGESGSAIGTDSTAAPFQDEGDPTPAIAIQPPKAVSAAKKKRDRKKAKASKTATPAGPASPAAEDEDGDELEEK